MTKDVIELAREAAAKHGHTLKDVPSPETVEFITELAALVAARERERIEVLRAALKPFADFEAVRSTMGASSPKSGCLWAVHSRAGSAEISVEDMQAAIRALNTEGDVNDRP